MHRFELRVRYGDTDQMGWVYYGNYLRWFEIGRAEMMRSTGLSYADFERQEGVLMPVLEARCRYLRGARYDELVTIECGILDHSGARLRFAYRVLGEDGRVCAYGLTEHCCTSPDAKLVRLPATLVRLLDRAPRAAGDLAELLA